MQLLRTSFAAGAVVAASTVALGQPSLVLVSDVVNGQTIVVQGVGRVPLAGIRAPAIGRAIDPHPLGTRARQRLLSLVAGRYVRLEYPSPIHGTTDRRGPAFVLLEDGRCINELLVSEGLARAVTHGTSPREQRLREAETAARQAGRGLWGTR
jgi:micrococcal nuclease